jgi:hypothetical protein
VALELTETMKARNIYLKISEIVERKTGESNRCQYFICENRVEIKLRTFELRLMDRLDLRGKLKDLICEFKIHVSITVII